MQNTLAQYNAVIDNCRTVFINKNKDYGTSWRVMRVQSIVDQIFIKAMRIRTIEEKQTQKIDEGIAPEYIGIINYCIMALIQLDEDKNAKISSKKLEKLYDKHFEATKTLMLMKNHDYGEAWRSMSVSTYTDMLLVRINRIKEIDNNDGKTIASEGIASNLSDMINYAVFALIRLDG